METDKENLQLQAQVLSEQVAAQGEKMLDLERTLHEARKRLNEAEQLLQAVSSLFTYDYYFFNNSRQFT